MKTVLIRPPLTGLVARAGRRYNRAWPPLDLLNCAALLRQAGADVTVVDFQVEDISYIELRQMVNSAEFVFCNNFCPGQVAVSSSEYHKGAGIYSGFAGRKNLRDGSPWYR